MRQIALSISGALVLLGLGSCALRPDDPIPTKPDEVEKLANPFAPAAMQIHGLTRTEKDAKGTIWIICHAELKDAWGDTTKGIGQLQVQLFRPLAGPGIGAQEMKWDINLSDLKQNVSLYDSATRTYRLPLQGAPDWVLVGGSGEIRGRFVLRAVLTTKGPAGETRVLRAEFASD